MDGDIDYSRYPQRDLLEVLEKIDGKSYPLNLRNLRAELARRWAATPITDGEQESLESPDSANVQFTPGGAAAATPGFSSSALGCVGLALMPGLALFAVFFVHEHSRAFPPGPPTLGVKLLTLLHTGVLSGLWMFPWAVSALIFSFGLFGLGIHRKLVFGLLLTTVVVFALPVAAQLILEVLAANARTDSYTATTLSLLAIAEALILRAIYTLGNSGNQSS